MQTIRLLACCCLLAALGCRPQPDVAESPTDQAAADQAVVDTLASLSRQFSRAYVAGDVARMMTLYTDDAVIFPNNAEYVRGKEAIARYWMLPEGRRITHHAMTPVAVEVSGSMASDFGHYEVSGLNGETAWGPVYGKYLVVWKRDVEGRWRMQLDMWNSRPAPAKPDE